jgi:polysaccharide pyruvyl transferase WcaK-like protein
VYARAAAILSFEQHSPIMGIAAGVPSILLRQPTDTRKGQMWRDLKMDSWIFEIDAATGAEISERVKAVGADLPAARAEAAKARERAQEHMKAMIAALP